MTIEERIIALEKQVIGSHISGCSFSRVLRNKPFFAEDTGLGWCLAIGQMMEPKEFFYGDTMDECVAKAEEHFKVK